jgi:hypothetical protein
LDLIVVSITADVFALGSAVTAHPRQSAGYRKSGVEWRNLDDIADVFTSSRGFTLLRKNELIP